MKIKIFRKSYKIAGLLLVLCLFLTLTDPKHLPSVLLIIPFVLLLLILYQAAITIFKLANDSGNSLGGKPSVVRPRLVAGLAAVFPVLLLLLQSIGQLSLRDVITVGAIVMLAYFYMGKFSTRIQST